MDDTSRGLEIDGVTLALRVTRKRVKNINVRLVGNELRVSAPPWVSSRELDEAIDDAGTADGPARAGAEGQRRGRCSRAGPQGGPAVPEPSGDRRGPILDPPARPVGELQHPHPDHPAQRRPAPDAVLGARGGGGARTRPRRATPTTRRPSGRCCGGCARRPTGRGPFSRASAGSVGRGSGCRRWSGHSSSTAASSSTTESSPGWRCHSKRSMCS